MLDQLEPETVGLLLGESFDSQFVDRVSLTDVRLEGVGDQEEFSTSATRSFSKTTRFSNLGPLVKDFVAYLG